MGGVLIRYVWDYNRICMGVLMGCVWKGSLQGKWEFLIGCEGGGLLTGCGLIG